MTQQNQQNPGQQVLWVLLRVSQANLSKIKAWKAREIKTPDTVLAWQSPAGQVERAAGSGWQQS
jgi:hypothetical protein